VRSHHERWDGGGYPDGIDGEDIPLAARIFAVADALDAMTSDRPYRPALGWAEAGREIVAESRAQFDPAVVKAFVDREDRLRAIRAQLAA
jgi:ribonuclease P protein subunit RPR2